MKTNGMRTLSIALSLMACMAISACGGSGDGFASSGSSGSGSSSGSSSSSSSSSSSGSSSSSSSSSSSGSSSSSSSGSTTGNPSGPNVATATVDSGPANNSANTLFVSVTVCVPGSTTDCQTIDHIEVDTASYGLRLLSSVVNQPLPAQTLTGGAALLECTNFVQGYSWGPVVKADVMIAGKTASSLPVQVIGNSSYTVPSDCTGLGTAVDTVSDFGANGILGIGPFVQDCGAGCAQQAVPTTYYACSTTSNCVASMVPTADQVQNPVTSFATDNNGVIVQLPSVGTSGAETVSGYLIFGVDTESNNASGTETVLNVDDQDYLKVTYKGTIYAQSFIDSGSNGLYFNDSSIPSCTQSDLTDFYCPTTTLSLSATLTDINGTTSPAVEFDIANTQSLFTSTTQLAAFSDLGGTFPGSTTSFDLGLPFYYGRRVATVIEGYQTKVGTGPYFAF